MGSKHSMVIENEKLVPKENQLQHCLKIMAGRKGRSSVKKPSDSNDLQRLGNQIANVR